MAAGGCYRRSAINLRIMDDSSFGGSAFALRIVVQVTQG